MPGIRDIIINLLHGLKKKQQRLRQKSGKDGGEPSRLPRQTSMASNASAESTLTQQLEDIPSRHSSNRPHILRQGSGDGGGPDLPPRTTSVAENRGSPRRYGLSPQNSTNGPRVNHDTASTDSASSISSNALQNIPVIAPYPEGDTMPTNQGYEQPEPAFPGKMSASVDVGGDNTLTLNTDFASHDEPLTGRQSTNGATPRMPASSVAAGAQFQDAAP